MRSDTGGARVNSGCAHQNYDGTWSNLGRTCVSSGRTLKQPLLSAVHYLGNSWVAGSAGPSTAVGPADQNTDPDLPPYFPQTMSAMTLQFQTQEI